MFKPKKQYAGYLEIAPAERSDLERIAALYSDAAVGRLEPHHTKFNLETTPFKARNYWDALYLVERRAKALERDIAGGIDYIIVGVEER